MSRRMKIMLISIGVIFGAILSFNLFKTIMMKHFFAHYEPPAVSVATFDVVEKDWTPEVHSVGNFAAINGVEVNAQTSGNVVGIHFESGQVVAEHALLVDIDDDTEQATLKFDEAALTLAALNIERQKQLYQKNATSKLNLAEAKAQWLQAKANSEKTQTQIRQKHITAPFTGYLGIRLINQGEYITPGKPMVTLQSLDPIYLNFYLPEHLLNQVRVREPITFSVEQNPNLIFTGIITAISSKIDPETHNIQLQATLPNCPVEALINPLKSPLVVAKKINDSIEITCDSAKNKTNKIMHFNFIPGMFASIQIKQPPIHHAIIIPSTAISYTLYGNSVYVLQKDSTVKQVYVETGGQKNNETLITKGLYPSARIISSGEMKLQNGTKVRVNNDIILPENTNPKTLGQ